MIYTQHLYICYVLLNDKMAFLEIIKPIRFTEEAEQMIKKLAELYPERFENNHSAIVRAAVCYFYRQEVDLNGKRKRKSPDNF
jgi:hypothetical protein